MDIYVVGSKPETRDDVINALSDNGKFTYAGWSSNGENGLTEIRRLEPEFVLLDFWLGLTECVRLIELIKSVVPSTRILVMSTAFNPEWIEACLDAGAVNIVGKPVYKDELIQVLNVTLQNGE
jgi:DNA-binding NarL/FixJ family response regulator